MSPVNSPLPLLLVADSATTCERIASALLSAPAFYRIERVTSEDLFHKVLPDDATLALVDGNLQALPQADVVRQLNLANIAVVALVDSRDIQGLQEVVLAGAAALLPTPFTDNQLWEIVAGALERGARAPVAEGVQPAPTRSRQTQGLLAVVSGAKGGSGTSMLAANLAVVLQSRSERGAVLIEAVDGAGSQGVILNLRSDRSLIDLVARFDAADSELLNGVLAKHSSGLRVLLPPANPNNRVPAEMFAEVAGALQNLYDFVIVDLHAGAHSAALPILKMSNATLAVILPEMTSLQQGRIFADMMEGALPDVHLNVVLNRSTLPSGVPGDAIRRHLKMQIAAEIPDDQALVTASVNRGVPLVISHPRSAVARAIEKLGRELAPTAPAVPEKRSPAPGPLGRLVARGRPA